MKIIDFPTFGIAESLVTFDSYLQFATTVLGVDESTLGSDAVYDTGTKMFATSVNWFNAVLYCNWRSIKHRLTPYYQFNGNVYLARDITRMALSRNSESDGYRLPTENEWELAAASEKLNYVIGHVWQWCDSDYYVEPPYAYENKVWKGGSWMSDPETHDVFHTGTGPTFFEDKRVGFRLAKNIPQ